MIWSTGALLSLPNSLKLAMVMALPVWLTPKDAADHLGVSVGWLSKLRVVGDGPVFSKLGRRAIRYRLTELDRWAQERERASTSERPEAVA